VPTLNNVVLIFDLNQEVRELKNEASSTAKRKTVVEFSGCYHDLIRAGTAISVHEIAHMVMEHCLVYYLCNDLPRIEIIEEDDSEIAVVNELYENVSPESEKKFTANQIPFNSFIVKSEKNNNRKNHYIYYCANSRVVGGGKSLSKVNSLFTYPIVEQEKSYFLAIGFIFLISSANVFLS
jgi:hypothetical protein